jgi:hypothetical protein
MNSAPSFQQVILLLLYNSHGAPKIGAGEANRREQFRDASAGKKIDLGFSITKHMNMGRLVVVDENHKSQIADRWPDARSPLSTITYQVGFFNCWQVNDGMARSEIEGRRVFAFAAGRKGGSVAA